MLILGRREGESILIEGGIRIVIVACDRGGVRIGIEAPADVKILRGEIAERVAQENQRATASTAASPWLASLVLSPDATRSGPTQAATNRVVRVASPAVSES